LVFCEVTSVRELWEEHFEAMADDFRQESASNKECLEQMVLRDISALLYSMGKDISCFDLPKMLHGTDLDSSICREVTEELSIPVDQEHLDLCATLNCEQKLAFDEIMHHVLQKKSKVFFIDGPGCGPPCASAEAAKTVRASPLFQRVSRLCQASPSKVWSGKHWVCIGKPVDWAIR
jgi:ATP-dependent DNA helicase PIF1